MPASQLKRLKTSLREQGITGQQKSKKQKTAQRSRPTSEKIERSAALQRIRDSFNPFELRQAPRPAKFATANTKTTANGGSGKYKEILHRPGVSRSAGEEMRRATLLPEMQRRNKTGGLVDRRIGEGDAEMTPEEKAVQRFARAQQKKKSGASLFDLEASDDEAGGFGLTHGGKSIGDLEADDFNDGVSDASDDDLLSRKRRRLSQEDDAEAQEDGPEHKKSRKEVMEEVIAKSKAYKYERQKTKEEDEDMREELDKELPDVLALLHGRKPPPAAVSQPEPASEGSVMNPERQKLLEGMDRKKVDKEYDARMRQLAQDTRAKPSERTKTMEEKAAEDAQRLKDLEEKRLKRMRGEDVSEDEATPGAKNEQAPDVDEYVDETIADEAEAFGLNASLAPKPQGQVVHDDEDDFALDEDLIASDSEDDLESDESTGSSSGEDEAPDLEDEEDEFVTGILGATGSNVTKLGTQTEPSRAAYTYPCPRTHAELLEVFSPMAVDQLPTVIQRIRALYHPSLSASNKEAMADFSAALVDHLAYMGTHKQSLSVAEQLIRHLHSLSRTYPVEIATAFRRQLSAFHERGQPNAGDLIILTAIGSIYPTSDHFHQVVTPAMTLIARSLGLTAPSSDAQHTTCAYLVKLGLKYQHLSKRYIPEAIRFLHRALKSKDGHQATHLSNLMAMAELWRDKSAFTQIFEPFIPALSKLNARKELQKLNILLQAARLRLRPLELHHHRKLPIRTSLPKFEEGFNPDKHYDPDKERSEAKKLQKEFKREKKGALRELRKDANFLAREQLREKKERDAAYDKKYKRLVAEIQGEEGHEAKEYDREKKARKRSRR